MAKVQGDDNLQSLDGAREVLVDLARSREMQADHAPISEYCDDKVLHSIVDVAWRHQFSEDRYGFKKEVRELEEYVVHRALDAIEADK